VPTKGPSNDPRAEEKWKWAFQESDWFKRGWTLLELIAPNSVQFFSQDGKLLGDKKSLEEEIHVVTGIVIEALHGKPLAQFSIDERLCWAETRETTVEEDTTYCLLGIFNIYMPLIYGEGRTEARARLRREIKLSAEVEPSVSSHILQTESHGSLPASSEAWLAQKENDTATEGSTSDIASSGRQSEEKTKVAQTQGM
jgi:hypothetical protein